MDWIHMHTNALDSRASEVREGGNQWGGPLCCKQGGRGGGPTDRSIVAVSSHPIPSHSIPSMVNARTHRAWWWSGATPIWCCR